MKKTGPDLAVRRGGRVSPARTPWGDPPPFWPPTPVQRGALSDVYRRVDAALGDSAGECRQCGKCCRFEPGGIILFASALELAHLVSDAGPPPAGWHGRAAARGHEHSANEAPRAGPAPFQEDSWRCPYQEGDLCTAREGRLLGCRTHFCEAGARAVGERIYADALREIQEIVQADGRRWWYGPARMCLAAWCGGTP